MINGPNTLVTVMIGVLGDLLFLAGLPGIQQSQPQTGRPGEIGLVLIAIGTVIAILANLLIRLGGVEIPDWIPLTSAIAGSLGSLIVGWLMIVGAILNILAPLLPPGAIFIFQLGLFAQAAALIGYGVTMLQRDKQVS